MELVSPVGVTAYLQTFSLEELKGIVARTLDDTDAVEDVEEQDDAVAALERLHPDGLSHDQIATLELHACAVAHRRNIKKWTVAKLESDASGEPLPSISDPAGVVRALGDYLHPYFVNHVHFQRTSDALWIRIFDTTVLPKHTTIKSIRRASVFLALLPRSPYLLSASTSSTRTKFVYQAVMAVMKCAAIDSTSLFGDCHDLMKMILTKSANGGYSKYRLNEADSNPLAVSMQRKRKRKEVAVNEVPRMIEEDRELIKQRNAVVEEVFGHDTQPVMQTIEFEVEAVYGGLAHGGFDFPMKVTFSGPSVIEGIRALIPAGLATAPLPDMLANLHSSLTSKVRLQQQ